MKTIDFDKKKADVEQELADFLPQAITPNTEVVINNSRLVVAIRVISNELLKDPVVQAMMILRNNPSPASMEAFLKTVRLHLDNATARRYKDLLDGVFTTKEVKNAQAV